MHSSRAALLFAGSITAVASVGLVGCSSGPASLSNDVGVALGGARITFVTEGKNTFSVAGQSCTADAGATCSITIAAADLEAGWNRLPVETKRRTDASLEARFFVPDELFGRSCTVSSAGRTGDPEELTFSVQCTFADGFSGRLDGKPMSGGAGSISAMKCLGDLGALDVDLSRPLLRGAVPVEVVGRKASLVRGVPVAVPAPVVQATLSGWASPWFEESLDLVIDAEPGATVRVNDDEHTAPAAGSVTVAVPIANGANTVEVLISKAGHASAHHSLAIEGRHPQTPLFLDQSYASPLTTDREFLPLSGRTHREARLYLNGRPVEHNRGRFELDAFLEEGKNDVQLLAVIEAGQGRTKRPVTRVDIEVVRVPFLTGGTAEERANPKPGALSPVTVAADPWAHVGEDVAFPTRIEAITENPSLDGSCSARIEGLACADRVTGPVMLGWSIVQGWVCVGDEVPVVVEADRCPEADEGDDLFVMGVVRGALGGRHHGMTRDRPSIRATATHRLPTTRLYPPERRSRYRPALLQEREKAGRKRR